MKRKLYRFIVLYQFHNCISIIKAGCSISINEDLTDPQPLLLKYDSSATDKNAFIEPIDNTGTVNFETDEKLTISCPGGKIKLADVSIDKSIATASCTNGKLFKVEQQEVTFDQITCTKHPEHILRYNGKTCGGQVIAYKEIEMGFQLDANRFYPQIIACFDDQLQNTLYTVFDLTAAIGGYQSGYPRPVFKEAGFYNLGASKLDDLYKRNVQRTNVNGQLSLPPESYKYIHATNDYYLARGHLAAKTDFLYGSQQRLTFYFVNVAPQWQTLNAGNWLRLEDSVRNLASDRALNLVVYTGTHGILVFPHEETGESTQIFLYTEDFKAIPAPQLFWKVVYHPESKSGVAFVTINNPYDMQYIPICTNICDQISWPTWSPNNQKLGFGYCCDVNEFRNFVRTLPQFEVNDVLN